MHTLSNVLIWVAGDAAVSESYCMAYHRIPSRGGGQTDQPGGIRYVDRFERRGGGPWLIAHRVVVWDWNRVDPVMREWVIRDGWTVGQRGGRNDVIDQFIAEI